MADEITTSVDRIYSESEAILAQLNGAGEISLALSAEDVLRKSLLLSAASYFEHQIASTVTSFVKAKTTPDSLISALVQVKAVTRQYHTWFDWDASNANRFFAMFGEKFKKYMVAVIDADEMLAGAIPSFIRIGSERNRLAHQDYASFALTLTSAEIYALYKQALVFVQSLEEHLNACSDSAEED